MGFSFEIAKAFKTKHGVKKIERNIAYTLAKRQEGKVKDIPAYLNMAIENDYGSAAINLENNQQVVTKKAQATLEKERAEKAEQAQLEKSKNNNQILNRFFELSLEDREKIIKYFIKASDNVSVKLTEKAFKEMGHEAIRKHPPTRSLFLEMVKTKNIFEYP